MPQKSCGVVVWTGPRNDPSVLLIQAARHRNWEFPKGHVDPGETEQQTALRELAEETGIATVELNLAFRQEIYYTVATSNGRDDKTVVFFLAHSLDQSLTLSHEHADGAWLPFAEAMDRLNFENYRKILREALATLQED